jgi:EAL and modified HD-GYP domain-containing signal transduction protein
METNFLVSRHPIFRAKAEVAGYELRSHSPEEGNRTIFNTFTDWGLDQILGEHTGFITLTAPALIGGLWQPLPKARIVLGYLDDFAPEDEAGRSISSLLAAGYRVALSDRLRPESLEALGNSAYCLKVDITRYTPGQIESRLQELRRFKAGILAERVDTYDDLEFCQSLGFDFYQGRFLSKRASDRKELPVNRLTMIRLLSKLQDPETPVTDLEQLVSHDVGLSFKLLRYANSAAVALPRKVNSIGHAVRMVGTDLLRTWASVLMLSSVEDKPRELMTIALVRARMCQKLAETLKNPQTESFFSAGLLSALDALLDCPMEQALAELPLSPEIRGALLERSGPIGQALRCAIAYENADWDDVQFYGLPAAPIRDHYVEAVAWSRQLFSGLTQ